MQFQLLQNLIIGLGLGLLVGSERERAEDRMAGVRTFTLITLLGVLAATLGQLYGAWILPAALVAIVGLLITSNLLLLRQGAADPGMTTEVAALLMFCVGALLASGFRIIAVVASGTVALLLHWKRPLHAIVSRVGEPDYRAVMRLVLVGLVILPILPDRSYGPYDVLNPFQIWLMVVLIVGISLASYVAWKLFGARMGTLLGGVLGGLISSTAATVGYARRTRNAPADSTAAAVMILIASTVVFARILFEIGVVAPAALPGLGPPLVAMFVVMVLISAMTWLRTRHALAPPDEQEPPSDLRAAIVFGLLYGAVLFAVAAAREVAGRPGMYAVAALSGLTDMDAITLSTAQLVRAGRLDTETGWRIVLIGGMANLVFKGGAVALLGNRMLTVRIGILFTAALAGGTAILVFWPG